MIRVGDLSYCFCDVGDERALFSIARENGTRYLAFLGQVDRQLADDDALDDCYDDTPGTRVLVARAGDTIVGMTRIVIGKPTTVETWTVRDACAPELAHQFAHDALAYLAQCGVDRADVTVHVRAGVCWSPSAGSLSRVAARVDRWSAECVADPLIAYGFN